MLITRAEPGGAQVHVRDVILGLIEEVDFHLGTGEEEFLTEELRSAGVPVTVLPSLQRAVAPRRDARALRDLRALIREVQPHLVHTHSSKAGLLGRLAARLEGRPVVHTAHSWAFSDGVGWKRKAFAVPIEAAAARITQRFIVVSEEDGSVGRRHGVARPEQLRVVHNGVVDGAPLADPVGSGVPVVIMVARMAPPKDQALLLEALAEVASPWELWLVGDGPEQAEHEARVAALGLGERVRFLGRRADVPELLAQAQVFVLASRQEGFPLSVLEAMRAGLPVVASDVGGTREAVEDGRTGRLVARGDREGMARALGDLLADPEARARAGAAGRAAYEAGFTARKMVAGTREVYAELATEHGLPAPAAPPGAARLGGAP